MTTFISQIIVLAIGVTVILFAGWGLLVPAKLMAMVTSVMDQHWGIYIAVISRLVLGAALIIAAPASPFPIVFQVLGWIAVVAAMVLALIGRARLRKFVGWWSERYSAPVFRLMLLLAIAFGGFIIYGVL